MKAQYGGKLVDVWRVSDDVIIDKWVQEAFDRKAIKWYSQNNNVLRVTSQTFNSVATPGDYLIQLSKNNIIVLSEKKFKREVTFDESKVRE
ncbi:MAG: hypothetical protein LBI43_02615 [Streptococcaceae bacterium]|nr:hypothetical protein [Streptococcaceae bacterium]